MTAHEMLDHWRREGGYGVVRAFKQPDTGDLDLLREQRVARVNRVADEPRSEEDQQAGNQPHPLVRAAK